MEIGFQRPVNHDSYIRAKWGWGAKLLTSFKFERVCVLCVTAAAAAAAAAAILFVNVRNSCKSCAQFERLACLQNQSAAIETYIYTCE